MALLVVGAFAVLIGLGTWQVQRLAWKEALIAAATERPVAAPVAAPGPATWPSFDFDRWDYRRVSLTGRFDPGEVHAFWVLSDQRGPLSGPGYAVIVPFTTVDGWHVLVNRGFVPEEKEDPATRPGSAPPDGTVTIEAILRRDDPPNFVTPAPDLDARRFYSRDIAAIAAAFGLPGDDTAPYQLDLVAEETPAGGLPQAGESRITFPNNHLQYAVTWYGLALCLAGVVIAALWRRRGR
nr:SURF1 family protein [Acuticoccus mangrovi]